MNKPKLNDYDEEVNAELSKIFDKKSKVVTRSIVNKEYYYPLEGEIHDFDDYRDLVEILLTANSGDVVRLFINSNGGRIDISEMLASRINEAQQRGVTIIAELGFQVASAATYIALMCDDIIVSPNLQFMIHCWSQWGGWGVATHLLKDMEFSYKQSARFMNDTYKGFLTEEEIDDLLKHPKDLYFDAEQVVERWDNMISYRQAEFEKMVEEVKAKQDALETPTPKPKKTTKKTK